MMRQKRDVRLRSRGGFTIGKIARKFGLSRSTLLYYDKIGLLSPDGRSQGNYRVYSQEAANRLEQICLLRRTGLALDKISKILERQAGVTSRLLTDRLEQLNREIHALREQQQTILTLLQQKDLRTKAKVMDKDRWMAILRGAGLDEAGMERWHQHFEIEAPEAHQDFLESLGLAAEEIKTIRKWSSQRNPIS